MAATNARCEYNDLEADVIGAPLIDVVPWNPDPASPPSAITFEVVQPQKPWASTLMLKRGLKPGIFQLCDIRRHNL
jgi:hypothetical protein